MAAIRIQGNRILRRIIYSNNFYNHVRLISTSKKNKETATLTENVCKPSIDFSKPDLEKNWVSYGFDYHDRNEDISSMHAHFFLGVSLCIVVGSFFYMYYPDFKLRDWSQREAYIELRRRESLGLPAVDCNYIPLEKLKIPSEEELADVEIII